MIARWLSPDPYGQFASPYVGMGNNPGGIDPDGGFCPNCPAALAKYGALAEKYAIVASRMPAVASMAATTAAAIARGSGGVQIEFNIRTPDLSQTESTLQFL